MYWKSRLSKFFRRKLQSDKNPENFEVADAVSKLPFPKTAEYRSDLPLQNKEGDRFNRGGFADRIAETILTRQDSSSLVIGIYGPWGDGKTSVLNLIRNRFGSEKDILSLTFNPWRVDGETALLRSFFEALASKLETSLPNAKEKLGALIKQYGFLLNGIPTSIGSNLGAAAKGLSDTLGEANTEQLHDRINSALSQSGKKVVVFIDDIDRLEKSEIQGLFRLIKLTADFENTIYILAFDERMVAAAIGERFVSNFTDQYKAGLNFLEKIVQVPLHLPPTTAKGRRDYCFESVDAVLNSAKIELSQRQAQEFSRDFQSGVEIRLQTPRMAKRYSNALSFALGTLRGESSPVDVMLVEALRVFYPPLFDFVRTHPDLFLKGTYGNGRDNSESFKNLVIKQMPELFEEEALAAQTLLRSLFPRTAREGYSHDFDQKWLSEQRVCSPYYFQRYFTYSIGDEDISDIALTVLIKSQDETRLGVATALKGANAITVIQKLRSRKSEISATEAQALALSVAGCGLLLGRDGGFFGEKSAWSQAGMLLKDLVHSQPADARATLANKIIAQANPPSFALEFYKWLTAAKPEGQVVPLADQESVKRALSVRIESHLNSSSTVFTEEPEDAHRYLTYWHMSDPDAPRTYIEDWLKRDPQTIFAYLRCFLGKGWDGSGIPIQPDFERNSYDFATRFASPELIIALLGPHFEPEVSSAVFYDDNGHNLDEKLGKQFVFIHRAVIEEQRAILQAASTKLAD